MERVNESSCIPKRYKVYYDRKEEVIMRKIILASASPRRKELLERAGVDLKCCLHQVMRIVSQTIRERQ